MDPLFESCGFPGFSINTLRLGTWRVIFFKDLRFLLQFVTGDSSPEDRRSLVKKLLVVLVIGGILSVVCYRLYEEISADSGSASSVAATFSRPMMLVNTAEASRENFKTDLQVLGELLPRASVDVMSRVSGRLHEVRVERGDQVSAGELLAIVDDEELRRQIQRAEASIAVARAGVNREEATVENLEVQTRRSRALHEQRLISDQDLEDLESRLRVARAQLELTKAQVEQAEASVRELNLRLQDTKIHAPMNGFVGMRYLDPGALVSPSVPIVNVIDVSRLKTVVPVTESALSEIRVGLAAEVRVDAFSSQAYRGVITRISPFLNSETRTADVEIEIINTRGNLKPGMFARVTVNARFEEPSLSVPRSALLTRGNQKGVYLLSGEETAQFRVIEVGRIQDDLVEILGGLEEGAEVITSGAQKLNEGDKVRVQ